METLIKIDLDENSGRLEVGYVSEKGGDNMLLANALVSIMNSKADFCATMLTVTALYLSTIPEGEAAEQLAIISEGEQGFRKIRNNKEL
jgi:hypothetical protein